MARNEEKQLGRLNRLHLQKQHEDELKKNPKRPHLSTLNTYSEIRAWLPSVTRDIDYYLKQMEVICYPERQIAEFQTRIKHLKHEYQLFVKKLRELQNREKQGNKDFIVPWVDRPYDKSSVSKREHKISHESELPNKVARVDNLGEDTDAAPSDTNLESTAGKTTKACLPRISLPVLEGDIEQSYKQDSTMPHVMWNSNPELQDKPLEFTAESVHALEPSLATQAEHPTKLKHKLSVTQNSSSLVDQDVKCRDSEDEGVVCQHKADIRGGAADPPLVPPTTLVDYSSHSSSSSEED